MSLEIRGLESPKSDQRVTDVLSRLGPIDDKHYPRWVRRTAVSKRELKGSLVVVVASDS